ncbi:MAG TPA: hypothetical protein VER79_08175 [Candidatus Limnocylindrales bacterium]|nr:hypothetical protein [Candidatus Limnocylindrales bacterium]
MSTPIHTLEHFYYGQLVAGGRLSGEPRLLASSPGVRAEQVVEALQVARLPAPAEPPIGAFGLLRGAPTPFFIVQSARTAGDHPARHVILIPPDVLRALGGNLKALLSFVQPIMPLFEMTGQRLPPLSVPQAGLPAPAAQETAMLDLMTYTRDRLNVIEGLLAAIVQDAPLYVARAPAELNRRIGFIEGLLALLPPPARYGITFATHMEPDSKLDAQIRFVDELPAAPEEQAALYTWGEAQVGGAHPKDEYSGFITSQLRLDTGLVIEQTRALTPVAGWRIRRGDRLGDALAYASYRLSVDNAVTNHLPADASGVAAVLADDPTLSERLRFAYVRHLLAFALALDDEASADLLLGIAKGQPDLERTLLDEMNAAVIEGKGDRVFQRVHRWLERPDGFDGMFWTDLLLRAATANAEILAASSDAEGLDAFLHQLRRSARAEDFAPLTPRLVEISYGLASQHRKLAETVFALAASFLPADRLQRLVSAKPLLAQLPPAMNTLLDHITLQDRGRPEPGLLAQVVSGFDDSWRPMLTIRLTEMVLLSGRFDLIDSAVLTGLLHASSTSWGNTYDGSLRWIVGSMSGDDLLPAFDPRSRNLLLQILLMRRAYPELIGELQRHNRLFYPSERQLQFASVLYNLFFETEVPLEQVDEALSQLAHHGLKPLPLAMAYFGALQRQQWPASMAEEADALTSLIYTNRMISEAVPVEMMVELFNYHIGRRSDVQSARVAALLPATAARRGEQGAAIMAQMYRALSWNGEVRAAGFDALRSFVRRLPEQAAPRAIKLLARDLGTEVTDALEATTVISQIMNGQDLSDYAWQLHNIAAFLHDTGIAYQERGQIPLQTAVLSDLDSLSGGLNGPERIALANAILEFARLIAALAAQHRKLHARESDAQIDQLLTGNGLALSLIDVFRVMGGFFARGRRLDDRERVVQTHPLGGRPAHELLKEIETANRLLTSALRALPGERRFNLPAEAIQGEIESLWNALSTNERRTLEHDLATDLQRIPDWALAITDHLDQKVLQDDSGLSHKLESLSKRPESTLEFYRFMSGYFRRG